MKKIKNITIIKIGWCEIGSYFQLPPITTNYYQLLPITTNYYQLKLVVTILYLCNLSRHNSSTIYHCMKITS